MSTDTREALAAQRELFESWAARNGVSAFMFTRDHIEPGCYSHSNVQGLWAAWQGALATQPAQPSAHGEPMSECPHGVPHRWPCKHCDWGGPEMSLQLAPTHYCTVCGANWRQCDDGTWNLRSATCGKCCDCAPMGDQIKPLSVPAQPRKKERKKAGHALVPLRMNAEMKRVTEQEDWQWEDLLAAAEAITLKQYDEIAAQPSAQPVAWIEHTVGGSIALCSTQEAYKVPMGVRFYLIPVQTKQQG